MKIARVITLVFLLVDINLGAEKPSLLDDRKINIANKVNGYDNIVIVCVFKEVLVSPSENFPGKGRIVKEARVVRQVKGRLETGDLIKYSYLIEEWPRWLKGGERSVSGELYYLLSKDEDVTRSGSICEIVPGASNEFELKDTVFEEVLKAKMGSGLAD